MVLMMENLLEKYHLVKRSTCSLFSKQAPSISKFARDSRCCGDGHFHFGCCPFGYMKKEILGAGTYSDGIMLLTYSLACQRGKPIAGLLFLWKISMVVNPMLDNSDANLERYTWEHHWNRIRDKSSKESVEYELEGKTEFPPPPPSLLALSSRLSETYH